jgi:hypothetical protein
LTAPAGAGPEYATTSVTVAQLFEHNRKAVGTLSTGAYRIVTRSISAKGDVTIEETLRNGADYRTTSTEGNFAWSSGSYQGKRWHRDANGLVLPSSNLLAQLDPFTAAFNNPQDPSNGVKLLGIATDPVPAFVVDVAPNGSLDERRYYNTQTFLLSRLERTDYDGHRQVWEYRDYRPTFGRMIAYDVEYKPDNAPLAERSTVTSYERVDARTLDLSIPKSKALFELGDRESIVIPAEFTDDGIIVRVTIAGRGLDFMLDSGASTLAIDPQVAADLGMQSSGASRESFGGDFTVANVRSPDFAVGELHAGNVAMMTAPVLEGGLPQRRVVGLLGTDFIASGALQVDFEKERLTLLRTLPTNLPQQGWSVLPLRMDYNVPILKAEFSGLPGYFIADLGAYTSVLYPHYFARFPNNIPRGMQDQGEMVTLGRLPLGYKNISMKRLVLGDWIFGDVQVVVPSAKYAQDRSYDGLIGRNILMNFNLIFDYSDNQLWFKPITAAK